MQIEQRTTFIHADDFGITPGQAKAILSLSSSCGGSGALNSVSIFANSPASKVNTGMSYAAISINSFTQILRS